MDRREWLRNAGSLALGSWLAGCGGGRTEPPAPGSGTAGAPSGAHVPWPVRVSNDGVIRTVVGLRPYRPSGFVVRAERLDGRLLVHNYGHGGAGITLSWGTAAMAADLAAGSERREAAVIGAGAVGLATARTLQLRGFSVRLYARDLPPHTTSNVAGGLWSPTSVSEGPPSGSFARSFTSAAEVAHRRFQDLPAREFGIHWRTNYLFSDGPPEPPYWMAPVAHLFPERTVLGPGEHPFPPRYALRYLAMVIEPPIYLAALMARVRGAGAEVVVREFGDAAQVASVPEPVVVNCTGLGAGALFGDAELTPVKGQLHVLPPQPRVDYVTLERGAYMIPREDGILLGGTFERGQWSLAPDPRARDRILSAHTRFFGAMSAPGA